MPHSDPIRIVEQTIIGYCMLQKGDTVLIGVSGGPDSVALLLILLRIRETFSVKNIGVAHLDHCLRGEASENDAAFVERLCKRFEIPLFTDRKNVKKYQKSNNLSLEEAARNLRYEFLNDIAKTHQFDKIALGHNKNDNAEQVLMQLIRGSGPLGMAGIPPVRGKIIRPLISLSKKQILNYLNARKESYCIDASNSDKAFLRNRVRSDLLPLLETSFNPNIVETIHRLSLILRSDEAWIETITATLFQDSVIEEIPQKIILDATILKTHHPAEKRRVLRHAINKVKGDLRRLTLFHIDAVIDLLDKGSMPKSLDLPGKIRVAFFENKLIIKKEIKNLRDIKPVFEHGKPEEFETEINEKTAFASPVYIRGRKFYLKFTKSSMENLPDLRYIDKNVAYMDITRVNFPLKIRSVKHGDRIHPFGMVSGTQSIKKYFANNKITESDKATSSVMESGNEIIWLIGHRMADSVKITPETTKILKVEVIFSGVI